jgi:signal transduction histidine kinase
VIKHAEATEVWVSVQTVDDEVLLEVRDNGVGFDIEREPTYPIGEHYGLIGMRERAVMVGGEWEVRALPGIGTTVLVKLPMEVGHE